MNDLDVKRRIREILEKYRLNPTQLAKKYELNQKTLNNQINGETALSASTILLILDSIPEVSAEWILRGEGEQIRENSTSPNNKYYNMCNKILEIRNRETELYQQLAAMMAKE